MIDDDDDLDAKLDAVLSDRDPEVKRQVTPVPDLSSPDERDEAEMTTIMDPTERRLLQQAARQGAIAPSNEERRTPTVEDFARTTARPPSSGDEPRVEVGAPTAPPNPVLFESDAVSMSPTAAGERRATSSRSVGAWSVVAFVALFAATWFAIR